MKIGAAAWGGCLHDAVAGTVSYFSFRLKIAGWECENSWALGQTWYRNGTEPVLAVRK
jgi:hypothetical protein